MNGEDRELLQSVDDRVGRIEVALLGDDYQPGFLVESRTDIEGIKEDAKRTRKATDSNRRSIAWLRGIGVGAGFVFAAVLGGLWEYLRRM